ncbi:hypothetical protein PVAP13_5NG158200 [Panicum virgatum]|uniref:Uncharacterized protein n=2 Tax=Panicum virgatum TaxID=38727 RepID=A0A8T0RUM2_PANVG|nr:hypothetical protein PVAP13_5NG158200 [Panicum virgatum]
MALLSGFAGVYTEAAGQDSRTPGDSRPRHCTAASALRSTARGC